MPDLDQDGHLSVRPPNRAHEPANDLATLIMKPQPWPMFRCSALGSSLGMMAIIVPQYYDSGVSRPSGVSRLWHVTGIARLIRVSRLPV